MSNPEPDRGYDSLPPTQDTNQQAPIPSSFYAPSIAGFAIFVAYLRTLAPTIVGGDTSEFVTVAYKLGVAHPPGYPLFTILAKLFTLIQVGGLAWRVNLLSAVCDTAAALVVLTSVRRWTKNDWAGLVAAGLFAFSPLVWSYAVVGEVFALNNLLVALMVYFSIRYAEDHKRRFGYLTALFCGLGMSNHYTSALYGAPLMIWILLNGRRDLWKPKPIVVLASCFLLGLLPYIYLPLADLRMQPISWGNTSTLSGFLMHVMRSEYGGTLHLAARGPGVGRFFVSGMLAYFSALPENVFYVGVVLAIFGLYQHLLKGTRFSGLTILTIFAFCLYLAIFNLLTNLSFNEPLHVQVQSRFWQQPNLLVCIWAGLGFSALASIVPRFKWRTQLVATAAIVLVLAHALTKFRAEDQHLNTSARDFATEMLRPLPANSIFWTREDLVTFTTRYMQECEGYRTDVKLIDREMMKAPWSQRLLNANYPDVSLPGRFYAGQRIGAYNAKQLFDANSAKFNLFAYRWESGEQNDSSWELDYTMVPFGLTSWILPNRAPFDPYNYVVESQSALSRFDPVALSKYPIGSWEREILKNYWEAHFNRSDFLIDYGSSHGNDRYLLEAGAAGLSDLIEGSQIKDPWIFKRLGSVYKKLSSYDPAYKPKMQAAWRRYLELGPLPDDPDIDEIRTAVGNP